MAACKDCLHFAVCEEVPTKSADDCEFFKDRSRFVELPCKHGDTLFRIINGKIEKGVATTFFYGSESHIVNCRFPKINTGIPFHRFGKTVFLSKKEAEQALKERESSA